MAPIKLTWSIRALEDYEKLLQYLAENWGKNITKKVADSITHQTNRIQNTPEQFPISVKTKNIRRCVISPQTSIFFKADMNKIEILLVFDNRQNPKKIQF